MSSSQIHCDYELLSRINCSRDNWEVGICEFFCRSPMFPVLVSQLVEMRQRRQ